MYNIMTAKKTRRLSNFRIYKRDSIEEVKITINKLSSQFKSDGYKLKKVFVLRDDSGPSPVACLNVYRKGFLFWKEEISIIVREETDYDIDKISYELYEDLDRDISYMNS